VSHYDEWLPVVGNTLKSIAIQKVESGYLFDIPKYCPNLRELRLNNFDERLSEAFWERVGVHLEVLEIFEIHPSLWNTQNERLVYVLKRDSNCNWDRVLNRATLHGR